MRSAETTKPNRIFCFGDKVVKFSVTLESAKSVCTYIEPHIVKNDLPQQLS